MQEGILAKNRNTNNKIHELSMEEEEETIDVMEEGNDETAPHAVNSASKLYNENIIQVEKQQLQPLSTTRTRIADDNSSCDDGEDFDGDDSTKSFAEYSHHSALLRRSISDCSDISVTALSPRRDETDESEIDSSHSSPLGTRYRDICSSPEYSEDIANLPSENTSIYLSENNNIDKMYHMTEDYLKKHEQPEFRQHHVRYTEFENVTRMETEYMKHNDTSRFDSTNRDLDCGSSLLQHVPVLGQSTKDMHPTNELHQCRWLQCIHKFLQLDDLVNHVNDAHIRAERDVDFKCYWENCPRKGKGFNARYKMLIHVRTHTNEKPYKCDICFKSFSRLENLKIHNRSHTGERPYMCPFEGCNKAYSNSSDRFKHVRTHQEQKPYSCKMPGCDKRYTDPSSLRKHIKTHGHYFRKVSKISDMKNRKSSNKHDKLKEENLRLAASKHSMDFITTDKPKPANFDAPCSITSSPTYDTNLTSCQDKATCKSSCITALTSSSSLPSKTSPTVCPSSSVHIPLPTYLPSLPPLPLCNATKTPYVYTNEDYNTLHNHHHTHSVSLPHYQHEYMTTKENSYSKHLLQEHQSLLSNLQPTYLGSPPPSFTFPLGNTLLTISPNGLPSTIPKQVIAVSGNLLHISTLSSDILPMPMVSEESVSNTAKYMARMQTASTQTDIDKRHMSSTIYHSPLRTPSDLHLNSFCHPDIPLDLSNPNSTSNISSSVHKNNYHPIYTQV